jgi:hypothetical protein
MDHKNIGTTHRNVRHVQEIDMVIGNSHDRVVVGSVGCWSDIGPRNGTTLCVLEGIHVEEPHFAV